MSEARITLQVVEALAFESPNAFVTQQFIEVLAGTPPPTDVELIALYEEITFEGIIPTLIAEEKTLHFEKVKKSFRKASTGIA